METNFIKNRFTHSFNVYRIAGTKHEALLNRVRQLDNERSTYMENTNFVRDHFINSTNVYGETKIGSKDSLDILSRLNAEGFTRIGDTIILNDGTKVNVNEVPKLHVDSLDNLPSAKENIMDFGSANYFKYTNSTGKNIALFSMPSGALCRTLSENLDVTGYDRESERYIQFWNSLGGGHALMGSPNHDPRWGYYDDEICSYLDEAGISKGFFSVKIGSASSELFYSRSEQYPLYTKDNYDLRYYTMTSSDFSYNKSVFSDFAPGTEITIAGENYTLKDDLTLDIPYGIDIFDIQLPKRTGMVSTGIDYKA